MHIDEVHFEEVFDVQAARGDFSFRSHGRAHYGVNLQCGVIPRAGSTFAIAFAQPGKWDTVLGCRDLASTEVMLGRPGWKSLLFYAGDFFFLGPMGIFVGLVLGGSWGGLLVAGLLALAVGYAIVHAVRVNRAITQALLAIGRDGNEDENRDNHGAPRPGAVHS